MTKRQMFLIAGTLVLAACQGRNPTEYCVENTDTQESFCPGRPVVDPQAPATSIDTEEPQ